MKSAPWKAQEAIIYKQPIRPIWLRWQFALGLLIAIALLSLSVPAVRAALSGWLGLSVAPSNQVPAPALTLVGVTPQTTTATVTEAATEIATGTAPAPTQPAAAAVPTVSGKPEAIGQMSAQAGWDVLSAGRLPQDYHFQSAYYDANHQMVILTYLVTRPLPGASDPSLTASHTVTLLQALHNDFVPMQIAPDTNVEDVQVNGQPAAFASGAWDTQFVPDSQDPNGGQLVSTWRNDLPVQNLYWQVGPVYLALVTDDAALSQGDLIAMAEGVGR